MSIKTNPPQTNQPWRVSLTDIDLGEAEAEAAAAVIRARWLTMGPRTKQFESQFAQMHTGTNGQAPHAIAVTNCTAALHLAYAALNIGPGDEVIMPALTFVATANMAVACGARPVFADVVSETEPTIDPAHIKALITPKTRAIAVVHYAGYACRMDEILAIAARHDLPVIEDAAHAPGVPYKDGFLGTLGAVGCFSFFSNKNMTTGEGGMILSHDEELAAAMSLMRSHGMNSGTWKRHGERPQGYDVMRAGFNYRTDEMRSAIGSVQLAKLWDGNARRAQISARYRANLADYDGAKVAFESYDGASSHHITPLLVDDSARRGAVVEALTQARIQTSHHYIPTHLFEFYRSEYGYDEGALPRTEAFSAREITLPMYPTLPLEEVDFICDVIQRS